MKGDFFHSASTGLYVSRKPLSLDSRVKKASEDAGIRLSWDDEGRINYVDFDDAKKLLKSLGSQMLTPKEYWQVYSDALDAGDKEMVKALTSEHYAEWLDRVYLRDGTFIDNPHIDSEHTYSGNKRVSLAPYGRPGWFSPEDNINQDTAEPLDVKQSRERNSLAWKYWSCDMRVTEVSACAPIRGYVTSVGKPSYDLGIPVNARQPVLLMRECRAVPLEELIDSGSYAQAAEIIGRHDASAAALFDISLIEGQNDSAICRLREQMYDLRGEADFERKLEVKYKDFKEFISSSLSRLSNAVSQKKDIVFVMGHKNPDTDTVVSSLFEAYRNHLAAKGRVEYIPIVQAGRQPDEVRKLLGKISGSIVLSTNEMYQKAKSSGLSRWISVDQNYEPEVQKHVISIIDHHLPSQAAKSRDIPKTIEMLGSCAALITRKYLGMGYGIDRECARILYGAALMDTENRAEHKMTPKDSVLMDYLKQKSGTDDDRLYSKLMSALLCTDDAGLLFRRDYKEDWGFGFAVAKIKRGFDAYGKCQKQDLVDRLNNLALKNNEEKNLPLTIVKIADYLDDNKTVNLERIYLNFGSAAGPEFRKAAEDAVQKIVEFEFPKDRIRCKDNYVEFQGTGMQISRKKAAPVLKQIVDAYNSLFFSPSIGKWVKRDFLKDTGDVRCAMDVSVDEHHRVNCITYPEAKSLSLAIGCEMLSAQEYFKVLDDARKKNDIQMMNSLQGSNFVEFLDSAILDSRYLIEHPLIKNSRISGSGKKVYVPPGNPGLISLDDIDRDTGIPKRVGSPNQYGNDRLWRYWQPDSDVVVPCRSYIFLLNQPCWDGKFHMEDCFPNLGIRQVYRYRKEPKTRISIESEHLRVEIQQDGDRVVKLWPKKISEYAFSD